jgi:hypothetical protein
MTAVSDEHCITGGDYQLCSVDHPQLSVNPATRQTVETLKKIRLLQLFASMTVV